jgi:hypothetical protein
MGTKGREVPRVVCCAIPLVSTSGKVLVITSRKRQDLWVCKSLVFFNILFFMCNVSRDASRPCCRVEMIYSLSASLLPH